MVEKLIVKNFASIKELEIEIKPVNILIGPQASGKSVCAKLLFYFKNFVWEILASVGNEQINTSLDSSYSEMFEEYFPSDSWGNHNFFIRYEISNTFIEVRRNQNSEGEILLSYSDFFKKELVRLDTLLKKLEEKSLQNDEFERISRLYLSREALRNSLIESLNTSLCKEATFAQSFIPASRSFFANLQGNIFSLLSSNNALDPILKMDPFLRTFGSVYENIKKDKRFQLIKNSHTERKDAKDIEDEIERLIEKSLCGKHIREKGKDFLEVADGRRISVVHSSSGQQEALPLTTILAALPVLTLSGSGRTVYIEEPEAHLFPNAQRSVVELIATVFNYRKEKLQFFITTHSPYVLTVFNNLLQAGLLYQKADQELVHQIEKVIPEYKALNTSDLSAYVLANGVCNSIICPDTGLIDATVIDAISDELAIEFDKLLDLA